MDDFCIAITTYEREDMLKNLLSDILNNKKNFSVKIFIFDDGSTKKYNLENYDVKYIRYLYNHGKTKYWKLITDVFGVVKNIDSKYFIMLSDDIRLKDNFFDEALRIYNKITDKNKICLNLLMDETRRNKTNWTNFRPIQYDEFYHTQWNDLCFISEKNFFQALNFKIHEIDEELWVQNPNLSSGVGQQISHRLYDLKLNMYHVKNSLVTHGDHESKMNYEERLRTKLIAI